MVGQNGLCMTDQVQQQRLPTQFLELASRLMATLIARRQYAGIRSWSSRALATIWFISELAKHHETQGGNSDTPIRPNG